MKIGLLIPCTSNGRQWKNIKESYLYKLSIKTFLLTANIEHDYKFYIGIDKNDIIFDNKDNQKIIYDLKKIFKNIDYEFIVMNDIKKGHLTKMWNILFQKAYDENFDYFFQCGDDINFKTKGWVNDCIKTLQNNNNIGLTGPINNNSRILTQAFVSRKHMEIFGWFFPEEIINWCCDDWYNWVYQPKHFFPLRNHFCSNEGGKPRYIINDNESFLINQTEANKNLTLLRQNTFELANNHKEQIKKYLFDCNNFC